MIKLKNGYFFCCLLLLATLFFNKVRGEDELFQEEYKKVDSLNQLAFNQKRYDVAKALNNLFLAENLASSSDYQKGLATSFLFEAGIFHQNGYDKKALSTYYKSLELFKDLKDTFNIAFATQQIALSLQTDGKWEEAIKLYKESLNVFTQLNKPQDIANINNGLGLVELSRKNYSQAAAYFKEALAICDQEKYLYGAKKALYNLGLLEEDLKNFSKAAYYYNLSLAKDEILNDHYGASLNQIQLSSILLKQQMFEQSITVAKKAYANAASITAFNLLKDAAEKIVMGYRKKGDVPAASQWQDSVIKIMAARSENEKEYALNFIEVIKSQNLQKANDENEILRARRIQKEQLLIITVGTFILIIVAVLAVLALVNYQRQRFLGKELKQKNEIIERNSAYLDLLNKEISNQNLLLEEDNKTKNKLLSIISHDLRTPLVNTIGILNLVNQGMLPKEDSEKLLQQLETQYLGTTSLLDNLLFWIKGQMSGKEEDKVKIVLYQLIKNLEDEHRVPLLQKKIVFRNLVDPSLSIMAEKEMIRIVCRNLFSNAIKFTYTGGFIDVISRKDEDGCLFLTIRDSGIGMSKEAIEKVNAKQYYNTTGTSFEKGSGFGLMLCRDLITRYGGELLMESTPGSGTSVTIKIPRQLFFMPLD